MDLINIYLMDMTYVNNTSGVDRYMYSLIEGLKQRKDIAIYWIRLSNDPKLFLQQEETGERFTKITFPMPQRKQEIIDSRFWMRKYNEQIYRLISHLFVGKSNCILHINTVNLIDLALLIRKYVCCKIISHLHCIPWKGYYDRDRFWFNQLYEKVYINEDSGINPDEFLSNNCEKEFYMEADKVICVTHCASSFLSKIMEVPKEKIVIIPNGIQDFYSDIVLDIPFIKKEISLLYVGTVSQSKGLDFILKALRQVKRAGYVTKLNVVGYIPPTLQIKYEQENKDLSISFLRRINFEELEIIYRKSDIGIIASLQEQCSYAAIEMCMFGLPIITTAVDGLDEIFTDEVDALKVDVCFSLRIGLRVDIDGMSERIIRLIKSPLLRQSLGRQARMLYLQYFTLQRMIEKTTTLYKQLLKGVGL